MRTLIALGLLTAAGCDGPPSDDADSEVDTDADSDADTDSDTGTVTDCISADTLVHGRLATLPLTWIRT